MKPLLPRRGRERGQTTRKEAPVAAILLRVADSWRRSPDAVHVNVEEEE